MKTQLELSLKGKRSTQGRTARRRMPTARWWFDRMHEAVNQAFDWTAPAARPQQIYMELKPASGSQVRRADRREMAPAREWVA